MFPPATAAPSYQPARPDQTFLRRVLLGHLATTLAEARQSGGPGLPFFVERELRESALCGSPARGFLRVRCDDCRRDQLLAFRCKVSPGLVWARPKGGIPGERAACPSCASRRMSDGAA